MLHYAVMATPHYREVGEAGIRNLTVCCGNGTRQIGFFCCTCSPSFAASWYVHPICIQYLQCRPFFIDNSMTVDMVHNIGHECVFVETITSVQVGSRMIRAICVGTESEVNS